MATPSWREAVRGMWARVTGKPHVAGAGKTVMTVQLDATLPDDLRGQVFFELLYDPNPQSVRAFGDQLAGQGWPCAAWALHSRAWRMRGKPPAENPGNRPPCAPAGQSGNLAYSGKISLEAAGICRNIDPSLSEDDCANFYAALTDQAATSANLSAYATSITQQHPAAARALQTRAQFLAEKEVAAAQATAQATAQAQASGNMGPAADPPPDQYTVAELNVPTADAAIAQAAELSPRVPSADGAGQGAAYVPAVPRQRPETPGGCVLVYRDKDNAWPAQIAKVGGGSKNQVGTLLQLNPHLMASDGVSMMRLTPGTEVNVPCAWEPSLVAAGFKLRRD